MKALKIIGKVLDLTTNVAIGAASVGSGVLVGGYIASRDVLNDPEMSAVVGGATAGGTSVATYAALKGCKKAVVNGCVFVADKATAHRVSKKAKKAATK